MEITKKHLKEALEQREAEDKYHFVHDWTDYDDNDPRYLAYRLVCEYHREFNPDGMTTNQIYENQEDLLETLKQKGEIYE
jgi:hypothetical protein